MGGSSAGTDMPAPAAESQQYPWMMPPQGGGAPSAMPGQPPGASPMQPGPVPPPQAAQGMNPMAASAMAPNPMQPNNLQAILSVLASQAQPMGGQ